jgi:dihydrofolate reductase
MRKLILKMELSVDGYIGRPGSDDASWLLAYYDEELTAYAVDLLASAGVHAMGRHTYESMAAHWPSSDEPFAPPMNTIPKAVFSRTLERASWPETTIYRGDLAAEIARLKEQDGGPILAHGGARFAQSLVRSGLVDEFRLQVHPIALGGGFEMFGTEARLRLLSARTFPRGTVALTYAPEN